MPRSDRALPLIPLNLEIEKSVKKIRRKKRLEGTSQVIVEEGHNSQESSLSSSEHVSVSAFELEQETMDGPNGNNGYNGLNGNNGHGENNLGNNGEDDRSMREINNSNVDYDPYGFYTDNVNFEIKGALISS